MLYVSGFFLLLLFLLPPIPTCPLTLAAFGAGEARGILAMLAHPKYSALPHYPEQDLARGKVGYISAPDLQPCCPLSMFQEVQDKTPL